MKRILACIVVLFILSLVILAVFFVSGRRNWTRLQLTPGNPSLVAGNYEVHIEVDGRSRRYLVHVPPGVSGSPLPLVLLLHGSGAPSDVMDDLTGMTAIADRERFLVAFPDAVSHKWNDGREGPKEVDDVHFIDAVIDDIAVRLPLDRPRVYATGISNGAIMSTKLACEAPGRFAAIAVVAGTAPPNFERTCAPGRPVPILAFLNTRDPFVPFKGGGIKVPFLSKKPFPVVSAAEFIQFWVANNGCTPQSTVTDLPDLTHADNSTVQREVYASCRLGSEIDLYKIDGAGHTWPGGKQYQSPWLVGTTNRDISASELIWQFFAAQTMPGS